MLRNAMSAIARDEARHAALSWRIRGPRSPTFLVGRSDRTMDRESIDSRSMRDHGYSIGTPGLALHSNHEPS